MDRVEAVPARLVDGEGGYSLADVPCLTRALRQGDERAFAWLHAQWGRRIMRYCLALAAGDAAFAAEVAQAVWLRAARHLRPLQDETALWNWLAQAARHAAIDLRRRGGRYRKALARFADWIRQPVEEPRPVSSDPESELLTALENTVQNLNPVERSLLEARYFTRESLETIATKHNLTVRAVEGRLARLRRRLRSDLATHLNP